MKILLTGICGFVGRTLAEALLDAAPAGALQLTGLDNFSRPGSPTNWDPLLRRGVRMIHGDIRLPSDLEAVGPHDWVIDAAANPSVLAGVDGRTSSRQLIEHNLVGTLNLLEFCKAHRAGFIMLSTSRVYSIPPLAALQVTVRDEAFAPAAEQAFPPGLSVNGVAENFSVAPPISLYGASKLASETVALEYGETFQFPVWINRCGVLAGGGQFGRPDQGIFSFWVNAWLRNLPLTYIGFGGLGHQVRDCLHPRDLVPVLTRQMNEPGRAVERVCNFAGGPASATSLAQLSRWCAARFGARTVGSEPKIRAFDIPWVVLDTARAQRLWDWQPPTAVPAILEEITRHAEAHPDWLKLSGVVRP